MNPTQFFKCLADETRLKSILLIQHAQELCVCELMMALDDSQPKISRHLAQLRKCGLLMDRKQSQWVFYRIHPDLPHWATQIIQLCTIENSLLIQKPLQILQSMGEQPDGIKSNCQKISK